MKELILSLSDFLKTDAVEIRTDKYEVNIGCKSDICVSFKAVKISSDKIYVNGKIEGLVYLECSRCLFAYGHSIEVAIDIVVDIINGHFNIGEELRQLLVVEMPMKPVCSRDCLGICKVCGRHNKRNDSCSCDDGSGEFMRERWTELLIKTIGGSEDAKSKKKTYSSSQGLQEISKLKT
ncbi:MAG: hypothetical protein LBN01_00655 [Endomicrobium sp.]|jgi:uncharacterized protein|nr:hypothetical protein [Endomicrobium sp.]